jgi:hypothetical protein
MKTRGPNEPNVFKFVADVLSGKIDTDFDDKLVRVCNEGDSGFPVEGLAAALPKLSPPVNAATLPKLNPPVNAAAQKPG